MKLRNKKTGGLANLIVDKDLLRVRTDAGWADYNSLAELNEEWEDYEEPKRVYFIDTQNGNVDYFELYSNYICDVDFNSKIGNYFKTKEEAEKAAEKLKAWKRLKDLGFRFKGNDVINDELVIKYDFNNKEAGLDVCARALQDVILLFGGEDEQH